MTDTISFDSNGEGVSVTTAIIGATKKIGTPYKITSILLQISPFDVDLGIT